jgi:hypothetical protein
MSELYAVMEWVISHPHFFTPFKPQAKIPYQNRPYYKLLTPYSPSLPLLPYFSPHFPILYLPNVAIFNLILLLYYIFIGTIEYILYLIPYYS